MHPAIRPLDVPLGSVPRALHKQMRGSGAASRIAPLVTMVLQTCQVAAASPRSPICARRWYHQAAEAKVRFTAGLQKGAAVATSVKTRRIDADSHFLPHVDAGTLKEVLPDWSAAKLDMLARDAAVFSDPNARRGGFRATAAGQALSAGTASNCTRSPRSGAVGHGDVEERCRPHRYHPASTCRC